MKHKPTKQGLNNRPRLILGDIPIPILGFAGLMVAAFAAGFGTLKTFQEVTHEVCITRTEYQAYQAAHAETEAVRTRLTAEADATRIKYTGELDAERVRLTRENDDLRTRFVAEASVLEARLTGELTATQRKLASLQDKPDDRLQKEEDKRRKIEVIRSNEGKLYRVPQEPMVWAIKGRERVRAKTEGDIVRLTSGMSTGWDAVEDALILEVPIAKGNHLGEKNG